MTKPATKSDRNVSTKIAAATFENDLGSVEVSGEKVWKNFIYFDAKKLDYSMEKVNFPENTPFYLNQWYLTVKKNKKIFAATTLSLIKSLNRQTLLKMLPLTPWKKTKWKCSGHAMTLKWVSSIFKSFLTGTAYRLRAEKLMVILPALLFSFLL